MTVTNQDEKRLELAKHTVIAEVYPICTRFMKEYTEQILNEPISKSNPGQDPSSTQVKLTATSTSQTPIVDAEIMAKPLLPPIPEDRPLPKGLQAMVDRTENLTPDQRKSPENVLRKNHDVFAKDETSFGTCPWIKFTINTGDHKPIKLPARPIPLHYRQAVHDTIKKYLEMGTLVPSQSPWASPILCVPKKDGSVRVVIDYRALNSITEVPAVPIPRTREIIQRMAGQKMYHSLDLSQGYHNVLLDEKDQPKTAIILPDDLGLPARQFHFTRLSFGLSAAPGIFQTVTDRLILPAKEKNPDNDLGNLVSVYLDDVCSWLRISRNAPKTTSALQSAKSSRVSPKGEEMRTIQRTSCLSRSRALQGRTENGKVQSQPNPSLARTKLSKRTKKLARVRRILSKFHFKFRKVMQSVLCITAQKPTIPVDGSVSHIIPEITESSNYRACFRNP